MPRVIWLLVAARAINRLGAFSLAFLTMLISTDFGVSAATAGLVSAGFGLATIPSRLAGGWLADRLGQRRTIELGLVACAVAQLGIAWSTTLPAVAGFAVLLGLAFELYEPPSQAIIADVAGSDLRVRAYSLLNAALAGAGMGAGLLAAGLGRWDLRWLFVADAVTCLACALMIRLALPADRRRPPGEAAGAAGDASPWRDRGLIGLWVAGTLAALVYMAAITCLPLAMASRGLEPADAGLLGTVSALTIIAGQPLLRLRAVNELATPAALVVSYLLLAAGLAGYATATSVPAFAIWTVCWSAGDLLLMGRAFALVADLAPPAATGRYLAAYGTCWGIAAVAAPVAGTRLLQSAGPAWLWCTLAATCLVLAVAHPMLAYAAGRGRARALAAGSAG
ncbi:MFS transporter [Flindersiella endophytica]